MIDKKTESESSSPMWLWNAGLIVSAVFFAFVIFISVKDSMDSADEIKAAPPAPAPIVEKTDYEYVEELVVNIEEEEEITHLSSTIKVSETNMLQISKKEMRDQLARQEQELIEESKRSGGQTQLTEEQIKEMTKKGIVIF